MMRCTLVGLRRASLADDPADALQRSAATGVGEGSVWGLFRARCVIARHGVPRVHPTYEALVQDPDLDAVYIALPNSLHSSASFARLRRRRAGRVSWRRTRWMRSRTCG